MPQRPDYILDIGQGDGQPQSQRDNGQGMRGRPWISVMWRCCGTYSRVYRNREATAYVGHCPKCARPVRAKIGPNGTASRFFEAS